MTSMYADNFPQVDQAQLHFWERRSFVLLLVLLSAVPLLWPGVPPLLDLPGHMGRYRVQLDLEHSPTLQAFYAFDWEVIGNLGVDLLVELLAPILGLEPAVKLIVLSIPALTVGGLLWVAREVHGRIPPTASSTSRSRSPSGRGSTPTSSLKTFWMTATTTS